MNNIPLYHIFLSQSSVDGHLGYFRVLAIVNSVAVNIHVRVSFQIRVFVFSVYMPRVRLLDHMVALFSVFFKEFPYCFP